LINATDPFGFGHVHPRGLLREPIDGVRRATAVLLTHADRASPGQVADVERTVRTHNPTTPIFRCRHAWSGFRTSGSDAAAPPDVPVEALATKRYFAIAGVGHPAAIESRLAGPNLVGRRWFPDHHRYTRDDWAAVLRDAERAGADVIVTTEKDWVKWPSGLTMGAETDVWRIDVAITFDAGHEQALFDWIATKLSVPAPPA
ncbi:MAG TPA: tetraacyldisaccharide 4'-kinase, partial [Tepidisphaeraceae bacterium]|nr:tetraacyldisaccharide 4'-kinase [Tepidisphaeraceae bacterium]